VYREHLRLRIETYPDGSIRAAGMMLVGTDGHGTPHGTWSRWGKTGLLVEQMELVRGVRHGWYRRWCDFGASGNVPPNGRLWLVERGRYEHGVKHGLWSDWACAGKLQGHLWQQHLYERGVVLRVREVFGRPGRSWAKPWTPPR
jgi:hypothetical protein